MTGIFGQKNLFPWVTRAAVAAILFFFALPAFAQPQLIAARAVDDDDEDDEQPVMELQVPPNVQQPPVPPPAMPAPPPQAAPEPAKPAEVMPPPQPAVPVPPPQAAPPQPPQPAVVPPPATPPARPAPKAKAADVSFNFDDADVFSVIQTIFGDILKVNYVIDPQVKGRVTYRSVSPIPRDNVLPLMGIILKMNGIAVVEEAGLYRIVPIADIPREPAHMNIGRDPEQVEVTGKAVIQVVPIRYALSSDVVKMLTPFMSANAQIIDAPKSNHVILIDTASNVKRLLGFIDIFDSDQLKRIRPQVYVYPVQNSKAKDVANILTQIFLGGKSSAPVRSVTTTTRPATPGQPGQPAQPVQPAPMSQPAQASGLSEGEGLVSDMTKIFADEIANTIIILASRADYELIEETIKKVDTMPRQVVIEALIASVTLTDNLSLGVAWSLKTDVNFSLKPFTNDFNLDSRMGVNAPAPDGTALSSSGFSFVATDQSGIVRARIHALASEGKGKVLAAPHILIADNREARIQVGQQVPLVTSETNVTGTTNIQRTIQYKDIGIILKVKPQVNDSGLVSMEISQEVSSLGTPVDLGDGTSQPTLNKIEATTNLVSQNGQTIIIGGLIRDDSTRDKTGIPFLSKIPLIGWLFGDWTNVDNRQELVILITPRVIRSQIEAAGVTGDYINKYKGMDKDIQIRLEGAN